MGLSWQQGPLSPGAIGRFLVPEPLPKRLLYVEPLRRRMRVRFRGNWIADSENVVLLFEPGHYPMAYFPETDISPNTLQHTEHTTRHPDLGLTSWYAVQAGQQGPYVFVIKPDKTVELRRKVQVGLTEGEAASITSGLAAGETVVTDGVDRLQEGSLVSLQPQTQKNPLAVNVAQ